MSTWWRGIDRAQPMLVGVLAAFGLMTIYSAHSDWGRQVLWLALGAAVYAGAAAADYRRLRTWAPGIYAAMLLLLVAVHFVGRSAFGARRWLSVAGFPLEPSELSKLLLVIVLAAHLSRYERLSWRGFGVTAVIGGPTAYLILTQPDLGTAIVVAAVTLGLLFLGGARPVHWAVIAACGALVIPLLPYLLRDYQKERLVIFLDPSKDPLGAGYNLIQARIAVGAGGLFGQGWLHGLQGQLGFVPERATDFAFAVFAEQFGLLGSLVLLVTFGALLVRLLHSAAVAQDRFGQLIAGGVAVMILVQVVENVGMNIGLLPIAGIPLPFISYGGSATITSLAGLGLVQSVARRRRAVAHREPVALEIQDPASGTVRVTL